MKTMVLVGFAEALSAPEVVWSLVDQGFHVSAFARKGRQSALRHSRHVVCHEILSPESGFGESIADLQALMASLVQGNEGSRHVLFPLDDAAVWLCNRINVGLGWLLAGPTDENVDLALDKSLQFEKAEEAGFRVPRTTLVTTPGEVLNLRERFPLIIKPAASVLPFQTRLRKGQNWICADDEELERAISAWDYAIPMVVQPFIQGVGEGVFGLATSDGIRLWSAHRRLRMMNPHGSGSSACVSQTVSDEVRAPAERMISRAEWRGLFMIELLRDRSGTVWFMEMNGRPWGSMALARKQGLEYPGWAVRLAVDGRLEIDSDHACIPGIICRHMGREFMYPLFVLRGPKSKALSGWPSFWKAVEDVIRIQPRSFLYNWRKDDPRVLISDCYYTVRDQIFKSGT